MKATVTENKTLLFILKDKMIGFSLIGGRPLMLLGFTLLFIHQIQCDPGRANRNNYDDIFDDLNAPDFQENAPIEVPINNFEPMNEFERLWNLEPQNDMELEDPDNNQPIEYQGQGLGYRWQVEAHQEVPQIGIEVVVVEGRRLGFRGIFQAIHGDRAIIMDDSGQVIDVAVGLIRAFNPGIKHTVHTCK